jgi:hypothetical protein
LGIPVPDPEVLRLWFAQHVQCYSTAFLAGELTRPSGRLTILIIRLTSTGHHTVTCQQRGVFIPNQAYVLFAINEHFEFLTRHTLVDSHISNAGVSPTGATPKCWPQVEQLEAAEQGNRLEQSTAPGLERPVSV